jgi:cyclohexadieny/prephenate dehydrogenase
VFESIAILAPGLLGGSVARAVRHRSLARRIVLWSRRPENRLRLRGQPWCDEVDDSPEAAVRGAQLVVLAAPVDTIISLAQTVAPSLAPGAIVTDVGSVKGEITRLGHAAMPPGASFVGAHPMAGSEKSGWEHSSKDLFERRPCFVTPRRETDPRAVETVVRFWHELGAEVVTLDPDLHDEIVAHISHLPQVVATTLCDYLASRDAGWRNFAGGGLRDTTRIAASNPAVWLEILRQNRDEILRALRRFQDELHSFQTALANRDFNELRTRLERGKAYRDGFRP